MQWNFEFPNKVTCEAFVAEERIHIEELISKHIAKIPHEIKDVRCMTIEQVIDANTKLGHTPQWQTTPKKKPKEPMI